MRWRLQCDAAQRGPLVNVCTFAYVSLSCRPIFIPAVCQAEIDCSGVGPSAACLDTTPSKIFYVLFTTPGPATLEDIIIGGPVDMVRIDILVRSCPLYPEPSQAKPGHALSCVFPNACHVLSHAVA